MYFYERDNNSFSQSWFQGIVISQETEFYELRAPHSTYPGANEEQFFQYLFHIRDYGMYA